MRSLQNLVEVARTLHEVELQFIIVSDATFYVKPLYSCPVLGTAYVSQIREYCIRKGLDGIRVRDMSEVVATRSSAFYSRYVQWRRILRAHPEEGLELGQARSWLENMASVITTADYLASPAEELGVFGEGRFDSAYGQFVLDRAKTGFIEYRAMKNALADIAWDDVAFPDSIRATIHQKSQPVLGLRVYPEYKKSSRLLPYHGVAVVGSLTGGRMVVRPEVTVNGDKRFVRVVRADGATEVYVGTHGD